MTYLQFPLWNPYYCGGNVMLANPQSSFLSPLFVLVLIFGEVVGVKIQIVLYTIAGMFGMFILSRQLGFNRYSSYLPPFVFMLSSWYSLRITEGHTVFLPLVIFPYVLYFYLRSLDEWRYVLLGAVSMTLIFLSGGVYPTYFSVLFIVLYAVLRLIKDRALNPLKMYLLLIIFTLLFGAIKVLPTGEFVMQYPRKTEDTQYHSLSILYRSLFSRDQGVMSQQDLYPTKVKSYKEFLKEFWGGKRPWGWHEYGVFIGIGVFVLYLLSFLYFREIWEWLVLSIVFLLLSLGDFSPINLWGLMHLLPVVGSLHGPSRIIILFVFSISIIVGFVLSKFEGREIRLLGKGSLSSKALVIGVIIWVLLELITVSRPVLKDAFTGETVDIAERSTGFTQVWVSDRFSSHYANVLNNMGTVNCYENMRPPIRAVPAMDDMGRVNPYYRGEVYLLQGNGSARMVYFSPNMIKVAVEAEQENTLILNQNYYKGWRVEGGVVKPYKGLISTEVGSDRREIVFYYSPWSFKAGLFLTITSLLTVAWIGVIRGRFTS